MTDTSIAPESTEGTERVPRSCEVCGRTSHEVTLVGLSGDRSWKGPFFCVEDHPRFSRSAVTGRILNFAVAGMGL